MKKNINIENKPKVKVGIASAAAIIGLVSIFSGSVVMADSDDGGDDEQSSDPVAVSGSLPAYPAAPAAPVSPVAPVYGAPPFSSTVTVVTSGGVTTTTVTTSNGSISSSVPATATTPATGAITSNPANKIYNDGTFTGTGNGFKPGTVVSVTILGGKISSIELVSSNDTPAKYNTAYGPVISSIIAGQKTTVATVSGATYSSEGMMDAVANALSQAAMTTNNSTAKPATSPAAVATPTPTTQVDVVSGATI